jgi:hypothetical protein
MLQLALQSKGVITTQMAIDTEKFVKEAVLLEVPENVKLKKKLKILPIIGQEIVNVDIDKNY